MTRRLDYGVGPAKRGPHGHSAPCVALGGSIVRPTTSLDPSLTFSFEYRGGHHSSTKVAMSDDLNDVNQCLAQFDVTMYKGDDGRHRIYGDINRIQDIIFSPCLERFPPGARKDLDAFFAEEVDFRIARCLRRAGVDAVIELSTGIGIEIKGKQPTDQVFEACFKEVYDWYRIPPAERPAEDMPSGKPTSIGIDPSTPTGLS
jgi:hypothetical protein